MNSLESLFSLCVCMFSFLWWFGFSFKAALAKSQPVFIVSQTADEKTYLHTRTHTHRAKPITMAQSPAGAQQHPKNSTQLQLWAQADSIFTDLNLSLCAGMESTVKTWCKAIRCCRKDWEQNWCSKSKKKSKVGLLHWFAPTDVSFQEQSYGTNTTVCQDFLLSSICSCRARACNANMNLSGHLSCDISSQSCTHTAWAIRFIPWLCLFIPSLKSKY